MTKKPKVVVVSLLLIPLVLVGIIGFNTWFAEPYDASPAAVMSPGNGEPLKEFEIVAQNASWKMSSKYELKNAMTYNGTVPGTEIRVTEGDRLRVKLVNKLDEPVSIHWHGVPLTNEMDGIPGVTQNAVTPGNAFTYDFVVKVPGTYWYHSHQNGVNQVDKGLYGAIIIEPKQPEVKTERDYALILDESIPPTNDGGGMAGMDMSGSKDSGQGGMGGMDMSGSKSSGQGGMEMSNMSEEQMMAMYSLYTINGKLAPETQTLAVKKGEKVRLRLINAGYMTHKIHLHGASFQVVATDGQPINQPALLTDTLVPVGAGERYDLVFTADGNGALYLESHDDNKEAAMGMKTAFAYEDGSNPVDLMNTMEEQTSLPMLDLASYGQQAPSALSLATAYDKRYDMKLGVDGMKFTINGKAFPDTEPYMVKKGDKVYMKITNPTKYVHPMHLHGHFYQVLSKNGKPVEGSPIMKDTLNVLPGEEYEIAFVADNPGNWMFHCHDLHHASAGMMTEVKYEGYQPLFTPDPNVKNQPE